MYRVLWQVYFVPSTVHYLLAHVHRPIFSGSTPFWALVLVLRHTFLFWSTQILTSSKKSRYLFTWINKTWYSRKHLYYTSHLWDVIHSHSAFEPYTERFRHFGTFRLISILTISLSYTVAIEKLTIPLPYTCIRHKLYSHYSKIRIESRVKNESRRESCIGSDQRHSARLLVRLFGAKNVAKSLRSDPMHDFRRDSLRDSFFTRGVMNLSPGSFKLLSQGISHYVVHLILDSPPISLLIRTNAESEKLYDTRACHQASSESLTLLSLTLMCRRTAISQLCEHFFSNYIIILIILNPCNPDVHKFSRSSLESWRLLRNIGKGTTKFWRSDERWRSVERARKRERERERERAIVNLIYIRNSQSSYLHDNTGLCQWSHPPVRNIRSAFSVCKFSIFH